MDDRAAESDARRLPASRAWEEPASFRWLAPGELIDVPVPGTALELDGLLRHLEIDGDFADWRRAEAHLAQARAVWERLEAPVASRVARRTHLKDAAAAANQMGEVMDRLEESVRAEVGGDVAWLARRAIHFVDSIERALE